MLVNFRSSTQELGSKKEFYLSEAEINNDILFSLSKSSVCEYILFFLNRRNNKEIEGSITLLYGPSY